MTTSVTYSAAGFSVEPAGFSSKKRYLREKAFGELGLSAGRTFVIGNCRTNTGQPWVAYRFDMAGLRASINFVSTTVTGNTDTQNPAAVNPVITRCTK